MLTRRAVAIGTSSFLACAFSGYRKALADDRDPIIVEVQSAMFHMDAAHPTELLAFLESQVEGPVFDASGNVITIGGTWSVNKGFAMLDIDKQPGVSRVASTDYGDVVFPRRPGIYQLGDTMIGVGDALTGDVREIALWTSASPDASSMSGEFHVSNLISNACRASLRSGDQMVAWHPPMQILVDGRTVHAMHVTAVTLLGRVFRGPRDWNDGETRKG